MTILYPTTVIESFQNEKNSISENLENSMQVISKRDECNNGVYLTRAYKGL